MSSSGGGRGPDPAKPGTVYRSRPRIFRRGKDGMEGLRGGSAPAAGAPAPGPTFPQAGPSGGPGQRFAPAGPPVPGGVTPDAARSGFRG
ncbi:MAG: hypothetical protein HY830_11660, partial [Actinobacteria bacterium]|nr:hypothetical protein [Actinomycetota bacterium]